MNENTQSDNIKKEQKNGEAKVSGKRRVLLKGAMGIAPAVLTLRSGAAFSLSSAAAVCVERDKVQGELAPILSDEPDTWYRTPVFCRTLTQDNGSGSTTFNIYNVTDSNTGWRHENYSGVSSGEIGLYDEFTHAGTTKMRLQTQAGNSPRYMFTPSETCYVLVQVDDEGNPTELIGAASEGTPYITTSCWSSATGGALLED